MGRQDKPSGAWRGGGPPRAGAVRASGGHVRGQRGHEVDSVGPLRCPPHVGNLVVSFLLPCGWPRGVHL